MNAFEKPVCLLDPDFPHREVITSTVEMLQALYPDVRIKFIERMNVPKGSPTFIGGDPAKKVLAFARTPLETTNHPNGVSNCWLTAEQMRWAVTHEFGHHLLYVAVRQGFEMTMTTDLDLLEMVSEHCVTMRHNPVEVFAECFAKTVLSPDGLEWPQQIVDEATTYAQSRMIDWRELGGMPK